MKTFDDSFDRYTIGPVTQNGVVNVWGSIDSSGLNPIQVVEPPFGARTGQRALRLVAFNQAGTSGLRATLRNGPTGTLFVAFGIYLTSLPLNPNDIVISLRGADNARLCDVSINPDGTLSATDPDGNIVVTSQTPVLSAQEWTFLEMRVVSGASTGEFELRGESGTVLINESGLAVGGGFPFAIVGFVNRGMGLPDMFIDDVSMKDNSGTAQNTFYPPGGVRNFLLRPNSDDPSSDWPFVARRIFGNGVGQNLSPDGDSGWSIGDAATLELAALDYTVETIFRANRLPGINGRQYIASKWDSLNNRRSWALYLYESGGEFFISFEVTTDGTTGTLQVIHDFPFTPDLFRPYRIAVSRNSGVSRLYIDGVRLGPAAADANTYFNGTAQLRVGSVQREGSPVSNFPIDGWLDEFRLTVGAGRYPTEYTPSMQIFPRGPLDPEWNRVQLLMGFDNGNSIDESMAGRNVTVLGEALAALVDDGLFAFQSINRPGRDDTFIEAAFLPAFGTLEFTANPANGQTVVLGSVTYTFVTALSAANQILIGVDEDASLLHLNAAVNAESGQGTTYGTGTLANPDIAAIPLPGAITRFEATLPGTSGNSLTFTTNVTGSSISGAGTLTGGEDIPNPAVFGLERLPRGITRIESLTLFTRRSTFGPGGATMEPSFLDGAGAASTGANTPAPANPGWQADQFDLNGGSAWTPAAFVGARIRVNRTT